MSVHTNYTNHNTHILISPSKRHKTLTMGCSMVGQRRRRWGNDTPELGQRLAWQGYPQGAVLIKTAHLILSCQYHTSAYTNKVV